MNSGSKRSCDEHKYVQAEEILRGLLPLSSKRVEGHAQANREGTNRVVRCPQGVESMPQPHTQCPSQRLGDLLIQLNSEKLFKHYLMII